MQNFGKKNTFYNYKTIYFQKYLSKNSEIAKNSPQENLKMQ